MGTYQDDRKWSDKWLPLLRALIGPYLLGPSSFEQDTQQAADLIVLTAKDMKIACRVRRHGYADTFKNQFTIRSKRDNGYETELSKVLAGWGDWFFYGHDNGANRIDPWWLLNLTIFRNACEWRSDDYRWLFADKDISNKDGTYFRAYPIDLFPAAMVIGDSVRHKLWVRGLSAPEPQPLAPKRSQITPEASHELARPPLAIPLTADDIDW